MKGGRDEEMRGGGKMYEVLKRMMERHPISGEPTLWHDIEKCYQIHLGVGDKAMILRELGQHDFESWKAGWEHAFHLIESIGYANREIEKGKEYYSNRDESFALIGNKILDRKRKGLPLPKSF